MSDQTSRSFSHKWGHMKAGRQYAQSPEEGQAILKRLIPIFGVKDMNELEQLYEDGMKILDAGCGIAWVEGLFNPNPNAHIYAVDLAEDAITVAKERLMGVENVTVLHGDLLDLPFEKEFFDIIFSNGVIHHTPDAEECFRILCEHLKPGGLIGIYIYCVKPTLRELADDEIRKATTEMSFEDCTIFAEQMSHLGRSFNRLNAEVEVDVDIPLLGIKAGKYPLQKFLYDHFVKCFWNGEIGMDYSTMVNFDWYSPKYASHHTREEVEGWFKDNNIGNIKTIQPLGFEYSGYFVSGRKTLC